MYTSPEQPQPRDPRFFLNECSGALGDLGTFLPLSAALAVTNNMNLSIIFLFAGVMNIATGIIFRLPVPVQPMKAIAAVAIAEGLSPGDIAASGLAMGFVITALALSGVIRWIDRIVPRPVIRGIQAGVGAALVRRGLIWAFDLPTAGPDSFIVVIALVLLIAIAAKKAAPIILLVFIVGLVAAWRTTSVGVNQLFTVPEFSFLIPTQDQWITGITRGAIPQLPLTLFNSVLAVCALSADLFPKRAIRPMHMALSVGIMNLLTVPFGAMPMCHGSGGLAAQYRFGARTGTSAVILGTAKILFALIFAASILPLINAYPHSILAVMIIFAGWTLMKPAADALCALAPASIMLVTASTILMFGTLEGAIAGCLVAAAVQLSKHKQTP